jgi:signal transduction histidine kinase
VAERIFKPFSQGDDSITRSFDGVGVGLALARSLLAMIRAELDYTSTPGKGSTFTIRLPAPVAPQTKG